MIVLCIFVLALAIIYWFGFLIIVTAGTSQIGFWPSLLGGLVWPYTVSREIFTPDPPGTKYLTRKQMRNEPPRPHADPAPRPVSPARDERSWIYQHWVQSAQGVFLVADSGSPRGDAFYVSVIDGKVNVDWPLPATKQTFDSDAIKWIALRLQEAGLIAEMQRAGIIATPSPEVPSV